MSLQHLLFAVFSLIALGCGLSVVMRRDPVKGALSLVGCFFALACLYLLQAAELIAVLEVLVYAGAIMVLFVFVIMLVENHDEPVVAPGLLRRASASIKVAAMVVLTVNLLVVIHQHASALKGGAVLAKDFGSPGAVGRKFFTDFVFQFELTSVLLLAAIVGAVIISRSDKEEPT